MEGLKPNPALAGLTAEQAAELMKSDQEVRHLLPKLIRLVDGHGYSVNAALIALATMAAGVMKAAPPEHLQNLYNGFNMVLRDAVFGGNSLAMPLAPLVDDKRKV